MQIIFYLIIILLIIVVIGLLYQRFNNQPPTKEEEEPLNLFVIPADEMIHYTIHHEEGEYFASYKGSYLCKIQNHIYCVASKQSADKSKYYGIDFAKELICEHYTQEHQVKTVGSKPIKTT